MRKPIVAVFGAAAFLGLFGCAHRQAPTTTAPPMVTMEAKVSGRHCTSADGLPDPVCTPGAVRTTDKDNICTGGSTSQYRPPTSVTNPLKKQGIIDYGYADTNMADYEEDHLISLELGGAGSDPNNLWPEPHTGQFNSFDKDKVENWLHKQICSGAIPVEEAQHGIATNWKQYLPQVTGVAAKRREIQ